MLAFVVVARGVAAGSTVSTGSSGSAGVAGSTLFAWSHRLVHRVHRFYWFHMFYRLSWLAGKLGCWKAGRLESLGCWKAGWLESLGCWKAGWLESLGCWKAGWLESHLGRLESQWLAGEPLGWLESHWGRLESQWLAGEPLGGCLRLRWLQPCCRAFIGVRVACPLGRTSSLGPRWTSLMDREFEMLVTVIAGHSNLGSVPSGCMSLLTFSLGLNATATEIHFF